MRDKNKENSKVPKSDKTRLSDLTPQKQARAGVVPTPPVYIKKSAAIAHIKKSAGITGGITVPPF
jgi:hypothetical protein